MDWPNNFVCRSIRSASAGKGGHVTAEMLAVAMSNKARQARARELNTRAGENLFPVLTREALALWLRERLGGARRLAEISDPTALTLPPLDVAEEARITRENPDSITLLGTELAVEYRASYDKPYPPRVRIDFRGEKGRDWLSLPDEIRLPGGREVELYSSLEGYGYYVEALSSQFKGKARECLNRKLWDNWNGKPAIAGPDLAGEAGVPMRRMVYGSCVVTGARLVAYGTLEEYYGDLRSKWFPTALETACAWRKSERKLATLRKEAREKAERDAVRVECETAKSELKALAESEDGRTLDDYDLRREVDGRTYSYSSLPSDLAGLRQWLTDTQALKARVEGTIAELARKRAIEAERRARVAEILKALLEKFYPSCPFCGVRAEWTLERTEQVLGYSVKRESDRGIDFPCCWNVDPSASRFGREVVGAIESKQLLEDASYFLRNCAILSRVMIGDTPILSLAVYHKSGQWNATIAVSRDALVAEGEPKFVELWANPGEAGLELRELRREREKIALLRKECGKGTGEGSLHLVSFAREQNPRAQRGEQWVANVGSVKFVLRYEDGDPTSSKHFVRVTKVLVPGKVLLVRLEAEDVPDINERVNILERKLTPKPVPEPPPVASSTGGSFTNNPFAKLQGKFGK